MKNELIIIGAGNVGGFLALNQDLFNNEHIITGFFDDDIEKVGKKLWGIPVLGTIKDLHKFDIKNIAIGIASPKTKQTILKQIGDNFHFPSFISKNSWVSNKVKIGKGVIIYPNVSINHETRIDDFVVINMNCSIGHNSIINKCCSLAPGVNFAGFTYVESFVEIGIGVSTVQQIRIGEDSIIGGQTMLIKNVSDGVTVVGNPGKIII